MPKSYTPAYLDDYMLTKFEKARRKYKPKKGKIRFLFIAESPPAKDSDRFFYFEKVDNHDALFLEMMRVLYLDFSIKGKVIRRYKKRLLEQFQSDGFYLIDSTDNPIPKGTSKKKLIRAALPSLNNKIRKLIKKKKIPIILISNNVYKVCNSRLKSAGFNVINKKAISFPLSKGLKRFRNKLPKLLEKHGWRKKDISIESYGK
jgi:hypothetical protein